MLMSAASCGTPDAQGVVKVWDERVCNSDWWRMCSAPTLCTHQCSAVWPMPPPRASTRRGCEDSRCAMTSTSHALAASNHDRSRAEGKQGASDGLAAARGAADGGTAARVEVDGGGAGAERAAAPLPSSPVDACTPPSPPPVCAEPLPPPSPLMFPVCSSEAVSQPSLSSIVPSSSMLASPSSCSSPKMPASA